MGAAQIEVRYSRSPQVEGGRSRGFEGAAAAGVQRPARSARRSAFLQLLCKHAARMSDRSMDRVALSCRSIGHRGRERTMRAQGGEVLQRVQGGQVRYPAREQEELLGFRGLVEYLWRSSVTAWSVGTLHVSSHRDCALCYCVLRLSGYSTFAELRGAPRHSSSLLAACSKMACMPTPEPCGYGSSRPS